MAITSGHVGYKHTPLPETHAISELGLCGVCSLRPLLRASLSCYTVQAPWPPLHPGSLIQRALRKARNQSKNMCAVAERTRQRRRSRRGGTGARRTRDRDPARHHPAQHEHRVAIGRALPAACSVVIRGGASRVVSVETAAAPGRLPCLPDEIWHKIALDALIAEERTVAAHARVSRVCPMWACGLAGAHGRPVLQRADPAREPPQCSHYAVCACGCGGRYKPMLCGSTERAWCLSVHQWSAVPSVRDVLLMLSARHAADGDARVGGGAVAGRQAAASNLPAARPGVRHLLDAEQLRLGATLVCDLPGAI